MTVMRRKLHPILGSVHQNQYSKRIRYNTDQHTEIGTTLVFSPPPLQSMWGGGSAAAVSATPRVKLRFGYSQRVRGKQGHY